MEQKYEKVNDTYVYEKLEFPTVAGCAILSRAWFDALPEYSTSVPTGVFNNKLWKAQKGVPDKYLFLKFAKDSPWILREYTAHPTNPELCKIVSRPILVEDELAAVVSAVLWWLQ